MQPMGMFPARTNQKNNRKETIWRALLPKSSSRQPRGSVDYSLLQHNNYKFGTAGTIRDIRRNEIGGM